MNQRKFMVSTRRLAMMLIMALGSSLMAFAASAENSIQAVQQQGDVKGTVTDANGETIIGATVRVLGTQNAAITDIDGNFTVKANPGQTLEISYIGCKTVQVKASNQPLKIVLEDESKTLSEVVVVGYGTMRKKDLTGSVVQINPNKIADQNPGSVQDVLRGTPGLQIGADFSAKGTDASIQLRGKNSLGTSAGPMIVLDGMPFYGELSEINPDDIGQIDVLKDASSAAIYGAKAAAGVIIITTKKGKTGKPVINVSANLSARNKSAYRDYFSASDYVRYLSDWNKMSYTYGQGENGLYGYYNAKNKEGQVLYPQGYYDDPSSLSSSDQDLWATNIGASGVGLAEGESIMGLYARRLGMTNSQNVYDNFLAGKTVDWDDETFRTGFNQDYNASISGATDNVNYYMSLGYVNNQGAVQGNEYNAFRANMKINAKVTNWLEIGANVNFQDRSDGDIQVSLGSNYWDNNMLRNSPYASLYAKDGGYEQYPMTSLPTNGGYNYP